MINNIQKQEQKETSEPVTLGGVNLMDEKLSHCKILFAEENIDEKNNIRKPKHPKKKKIEDERKVYLAEGTSLSTIIPSDEESFDTKTDAYKHENKRTRDSDCYIAERKAVSAMNMSDKEDFDLKYNIKKQNTKKSRKRANVLDNIENVYLPNGKLSFQIIHCDKDDIDTGNEMEIHKQKQNKEEKRYFGISDNFKDKTSTNKPLSDTDNIDSEHHEPEYIESGNVTMKKVSHYFTLFDDEDFDKTSNLPKLRQKKKTEKQKSEGLISRKISSNMELAGMEDDTHKIKQKKKKTRKIGGVDNREKMLDNTIQSDAEDFVTEHHGPKDIDSGNLTKKTIPSNFKLLDEEDLYKTSNVSKLRQKKKKKKHKSESISFHKISSDMKFSDTEDITAKTKHTKKKKRIFGSDDSRDDKLTFKIESDKEDFGTGIHEPEGIESIDLIGKKKMSPHIEEDKINNPPKLKHKKKKKKANIFEQKLSSDILSERELSNTEIGKQMKMTRNEQESRKSSSPIISSDVKFLDTKNKKQKRKKKKNRNKESNGEGSVHEEKTSDQEIKSDTELDDNEIKHFKITIQKESWEKIKPRLATYGKQRRQIRKLVPPWTDVFSSEVNKIHKGCVLRFKKQHIRAQNSRKAISAPFLVAHAHCVGKHCSAKYKFTKNKESSMEGNIKIRVAVSGTIFHGPDEVNRRSIVGKQRLAIADRITKSSSSKVYYDNILDANEQQMELGNYTEVPNPTVLRKIISEQIKKENFHENALAELQVLKENYEQEDDPFIRDIGLDPFCVIMFSKKQIDLAKSLSRKEKLNIYIDSTGSVIRNIPNQKRPYLYSMVVKPTADLPPVSIADMLSTQHTIPRIELFFGQIRREFDVGKSIKIKKIETDGSMALIQSSLRSFNCLNIKTYLRRCLTVMMTDELPPDLIVHHICNSHTMRDFINSLKKGTDRLSKETRIFAYKCFWILGNITALDEGKSVFRYLCSIFLNKYDTPMVKKALRNINQRDVDEIEDDEEFNTEYREELEMADVTIREASPFNEIFKKEERMILTEITEDKTDNNSYNRYYAPGIIKCLQDKFMYMFPMWTGIMLNIGAQDEITTRDTNANVENWFKTVKHDIGLKSHTRPSKVVIALKSAINARIKELSFPGSRKRQSKKRKANTIETVEEIWNKKSKKSRKIDRSFKEARDKADSLDTKSNLPAVPKWGGKIEGQSLVNTCTIDNCLTILYLCYKENENFRYFLQQSTNDLFKTLLTVLHFMSNQEFAAAKVIWINHIQKHKRGMTDLYGDEMDFVVTFFDREWNTYTQSKCDDPSCKEPYKESRPLRGINISLSRQAKNLQDVIYRWMSNTSQCDNYDSDASSTGKSLTVCSGTRHNSRVIIEDQPVAFIRVYEPFIQGNITLEQILEKDYVLLHQSAYRVAGVTMYKNDHYCAIVNTCYGAVWYDGLLGKLNKFKWDKKEWSPCNVVLCQVH